MLTSVHIVSYRSCKRVRLDALGNIAVLIGKNGVGKTNILKAIAWIASVASSVPSSKDVTAGVLLDDNPHVEITCRIKDWTFSYWAKVTFDGSREAGKEIRLAESLTAISTTGEFKQLIDRDGGDLRFDVGPQIAQISPASRAIPSVLSLFAEESNSYLVRSFANYMDGVKYYPLDEVDSEVTTHRGATGFLVQSEFSAWKNGAREARDSNELILYKLLHLFLHSTQDFDALQSLLGQNGLGIVDRILVQALEIGAPSGETYHLFQFQPSGHPAPKVFPFDSLSFGTRRIIRLLTSLFYDESTIFLFEQPEDGIHTGLLSRLLPLIRAHADPAQFLISSHSAEVLNRTAPTEVRIVEMKNGVTSVNALTAEQVAIADQYMREDGPLTEFLQVLADR